MGSSAVRTSIFKKKWQNACNLICKIPQHNGRVCPYLRYFNKTIWFDSSLLSCEFCFVIFLCSFYVQHTVYLFFFLNHYTSNKLIIHTYSIYVVPCFVLFFFLFVWSLYSDQVECENESLPGLWWGLFLHW